MEHSLNLYKMLHSTGGWTLASMETAHRYGSAYGIGVECCIARVNGFWHP